MEKGDTVYATRRGTVVEVGIPEREPDAPAAGLTSESPDLLVEQPDGTLAWYISPDGDNVLVEVGDEVLPGTPLALAGSYDGERYKFPCRPSGGRVIRTRRSGSENLSSASISFRGSLRRRVSCALKRASTRPR